MKQYRIVFQYGQWQVYSKLEFDGYWNSEITCSNLEDAIRHVYYGSGRPVAIPLIIES